jgi:hypothetical protein
MTRRNCYLLEEPAPPKPRDAIKPDRKVGTIEGKKRGFRRIALPLSRINGRRVSALWAEGKRYVRVTPHELTWPYLCSVRRSFRLRPIDAMAVSTPSSYPGPERRAQPPPLPTPLRRHTAHKACPALLFQAAEPRTESKLPTARTRHNSAALSRLLPPNYTKFTPSGRTHSARRQRGGGTNEVLRTSDFLAKSG